MLKGKPTKYGTGITIYGDYYDLNSLYETVSKMADPIEDPTTDGLLFMSMAYDLRKSREGRRETFEEGSSEWKITYKGFNMFWPDFLVLLNLIRQRAGNTGGDPEIQANIYRLEFLAYESLIAFDANAGNKIVKWMKETKMIFDPYLFQMLDQVRMDHLTEKNGKTRFKKLLRNMKPFNGPFDPTYKEIIAYFKREAKRLNCRIEDLRGPEDLDALAYKW